MEIFGKLLTGLNAAQKKAVQTIDGPLLVIAGPGTGKTHVLSMRIANILKTTDTAPENILCLAFTNKAVNNMQERLSRIIGAPAHAVWVKTFHSFAAEIIAQNPDYFWNGAKLSHVPDAVELEIITDILSALPLDNPLALKFAGEFTAINDIKQGLKLSKEAGLSPEKLKAVIEANISYIDLIEKDLCELTNDRLSIKHLPKLLDNVLALPDQQIDEMIKPLVSLSTVIKESLAAAVEQDLEIGKTTNSGAWKKRFIQTVEGQKSLLNERKRNGWWLALAGVYESYHSNLSKRGYYDYADMLLELINALETHADFRSLIQEKFNYVLIDEFQDCNAAQLRLAHLVADSYTSGGRPNIMAVGDDDQAIFKFNGAELSNVLDFRRSYKNNRPIVLSDSYRSSQAVLDTAKAIIGQSGDRLISRMPELKKNLIAVSDVTKGEIDHQTFETAGQQYNYVAKMVKKSFDNGEQVAVLARSHDSLRAMTSQLEQLQVPLLYEQLQNILEHPAVMQVIAIVTIIEAIKAGDKTIINQQLSYVLSHPMWLVDPKTVWRLALNNRHTANWLDTMLNSKNIQLKQLGDWLLWLAVESQQLPLSRLMEYIIGLKASLHLTSPLREYYLQTSDVDGQYMQALSAIKNFLSLTNEFSRHNNGATADFVRLVGVNNRLDYRIADETLLIGGERAVELLSVHKAKGLEFDRVFIVDCIDSQWRPRLSGRQPPVNLPLRPNGDDYNDYIRLMFVAATRARRNLHFTSYDNDEKGQPVLAASVIRDILPAKPTNPGQAQTIEILESSLSWPDITIHDKKLLLKNLLQNFSLSATALASFLDVSRGGPQNFLQSQILRLPEAQSTTLAYGSAIHASLEHAQRLSSGAGFSLPEIIKVFVDNLASAYLPETEQKRYEEHGKMVLTRLFNDYKLPLPPEAKAEARFQNIRIGEAALNGKIDHLYLLKNKQIHKTNELFISDYKTGKPLPSLFTKNQTLAVNAWRARTQLLFYALLCSKSKTYSAANSITGQIIYVEAESPKQLIKSMRVEPEEIKQLTKLIGIVWGKIMSLELPDTSKYSQDYQGIEQFTNDLLRG